MKILVSVYLSSQMRVVVVYGISLPTNTKKIWITFLLINPLIPRDSISM